MKINIEINENIEEVEVNIVCNAMTEDIEKIMSMLNVFDKKLVVKKDGKTFFINNDDVFYIDTVDKKTFVYTKDEVYESSLKLYELEEEFEFFRASRSCIINLKYIKYINTALNGKIRITMENDEVLIVSRQYALELKLLLGVK